MALCVLLNGRWQCVCSLPSCTQVELQCLFVFCSMEHGGVVLSPPHVLMFDILSPNDSCDSLLKLGKGGSVLGEPSAAEAGSVTPRVSQCVWGPWVGPWVGVKGLKGIVFGPCSRW